MKIPLSWLRQYLPTKLSDSEIAETLTSIGLEFEGAEEGVMEVALTPNLSHCASIRGIARELSAVTSEKLTLPKQSIVENHHASTSHPLSLEVKDPKGCPRYACRVITGVHISPSPDWLMKQLEQCGLRSVNNVVDITNLVLLEMGQPLHAFDFDKLAQKKIVVRRALKGETIITLDGKCHYPTEESLLICDAEKPIAIAGIMGSLESEITDATKTIVIESAYFEPTQVRKTAKRMDLHTQSSYRFERGVDPNSILEALDMATAWICDLAGGAALRSIDIQSEQFHPIPVSCRLDRINQILGTQLGMSEVETIFRRLDFEIKHIREKTISLTIPTYRHDIHQEIDLIEEVARLYGYRNIHKKESPFFRTGSLAHSAEYLFTGQIRTALLAEGLQECLTCDLISPSQAALIPADIFPARTLIKLLNPHSSEQSVMRPSLLPGLLSVIRYNEDHGIESVSGFEVGRVHFDVKGKYLEPPVAGIIMTGKRHPFNWETKDSFCDFYDLKGIIENLFLRLKIRSATFKASPYTIFHPGRQATILVGDKEMGVIGEIHPLVLNEAGVNRPVYYAEIDLQDIQQFIPKEIRMTPLPQFPASSRDWTVTVSEKVAVGTLIDTISSYGTPLLESVCLIEPLYRSPTLGPEKKNMTLRFIYRDHNKTISQAEVDNEHLRLIEKISEFLKRETS